MNKLFWSMLHSKRKCSEWTEGLFKNKNIRSREESLRLLAWFSWSRDEKNEDNTGSSQWLKAPLGDCRFVTVSWRNVTSARDGGGRLWEWKMIREKLLHSFRLFPPEGYVLVVGSCLLDSTMLRKTMDWGSTLFYEGHHQDGHLLLGDMQINVTR